MKSPGLATAMIVVALMAYACDPKTPKNPAPNTPPKPTTDAVVVTGDGLRMPLSYNVMRRRD